VNLVLSIGAASPRIFVRENRYLAKKRAWVYGSWLDAANNFLIIVTENGIATQGDSRKIDFDCRWIKSIEETHHDACFGSPFPFLPMTSHNA
jgi:hypothetical protein